MLAHLILPISLWGWLVSRYFIQVFSTFHKEQIEGRGWDSHLGLLTICFSLLIRTSSTLAPVKKPENIRSHTHKILYHSSIYNGKTLGNNPGRAMACLSDRMVCSSEKSEVSPAPGSSVHESVTLKLWVWPATYFQGRRGCCVSWWESPQDTCLHCFINIFCTVKKEGIGQVLIS